ncbi:MAG: 4-deoxy-4-formamido-L-arabinose-phosphoundecaprenol deformylase [Betaproteobacteria bacterium]|nr:MAG: 4-deoxy-4-formamido-L-arabinose-phosphoundecaprenol deformylase [Betaproteobacteria bacterium]
MLAASLREPDSPPPAPCRRLALKVDVSTYLGTIEGVPRLVEALRRHHANATFLFSLGPDHTGRGIRRMLRRGFARKPNHTSVLEHYGMRTLLYGTLLPGPDIGKRCADTMRMVADLGFEVGVHAWDRTRWQNDVMAADADWTSVQMQRARERFEEIFGAPPRVHGAAGWQMNVHGYRLTQRLGFDYCSDTRGFRPFIPVFNAELVACPQIPTTLPTCDELIGRDATTAEDFDDKLIAAAALDLPAGHVFTLRAELEGRKLLAIFERLLSRWKDQGKTFLSLGEYIAAAGRSDLPRHAVVHGTVPGAIGTLALQGAEFLL